jgi:hypothetical protein
MEKAEDAVKNILKCLRCDGAGWFPASELGQDGRPIQTQIQCDCFGGKIACCDDKLEERIIDALSKRDKRILELEKENAYIKSTQQTATNQELEVEIEGYKAAFEILNQTRKRFNHLNSLLMDQGDRAENFIPFVTSELWRVIKLALNEMNCDHDPKKLKGQPIGMNVLRK